MKNMHGCIFFVLALTIFSLKISAEENQVQASQAVKEENIGVFKYIPNDRKSLISAINFGKDEDLNKKIITFLKKKKQAEYCLKNQTEYLCKVIFPNKVINKKVSKESLSIKDFKTIQRNLEDADLVKLSKYSQEELLEALKTFNSKRAVIKIAEDLTSSNSVFSTELLISIALEVEEFFPEQDNINLARKLYLKAISSSAEYDKYSKALYRLALIEYWQKNYNDAFEYFQKIIKNEKNGDIKLRGYFWGARTAKELGKTEKEKEFLKELQDNYPFSFHTLLVKKQEYGEKEEKIVIANSEIVYNTRSKKIIEANDYLKVAEALITFNSNEFAKKVLRNIVFDFKTLEPEVIFYIGLLQDYLKDDFNKFRTFSFLFKHHGTFLAKPSLQLMFPYQQKENIKKYKLKLDEYFILSVIRQESAFNPKARSPAGALGLMQLMPKTAKKYERVRSKSLFEPSVNIRIGAKYFTKLLSMYGNDIELAVAAYNAGEEKVDGWLKRYTMTDRILFVDLIPFRETREYVASIVRNYFWYSLLYKDKGSKVSLDENEFNYIFTTVITSRKDKLISVAREM